MELFATHIPLWDSLSENTLKSFLDESDLNRLTHVSHPKRRRELLVGRAFIKYTLGDVLGKEAHHIKLTLKNDRIPYLADSSVCFSLSHSGPIILLAVSDHPVGVDIEQLKNHNFERLKRLLAPAQQKTLHLCPTVQDKAAFFTRCWTMREAAFKLDAITGTSVLQAHFLSGRVDDFYIAVAANVTLSETSVQFKGIHGISMNTVTLNDRIVS